MKKDLIFSPILLAIGVALFLLRFTDIVAHIAISIVGLVLLVVYAALTKKDWKIPALEVIMRVFYAIALITGIVIMAASGIAAVALAHKVCALLYVILLVVLLISKIVSSKKA